MSYLFVRTVQNKGGHKVQVVYPLREYKSEMTAVDCISASTHAMHIDNVVEDLADMKVVGYPDNDETNFVLEPR